MADPSPLRAAHPPASRPISLRALKACAVLSGVWVTGWLVFLLAEGVNLLEGSAEDYLALVAILAFAPFLSLDVFVVARARHSGWGRLGLVAWLAYTVVVVLWWRSGHRRLPWLTVETVVPLVALVLYVPSVCVVAGYWVWRGFGHPRSQEQAGVLRPHPQPATISNLKQHPVSVVLVMLLGMLFTWNAYLHHELSRVRDHVNEIEGQAQEVEEKAEELEAKAADIEEKLKDVEEKADGAESNVEELAGRLRIQL
jgi:hypothetical protein